MNKYRRKAYLVLLIDLSTMQVTRAGIYSSSALNLTCRMGEELYVDVFSCESEDYSEARANMIKCMNCNPALRELLNSEVWNG